MATISRRWPSFVKNAEHLLRLPLGSWRKQASALRTRSWV